MGKVLYNRGDGIVKVIVEDDSGKKIEVFKANQSDKKEHSKIGRALKQKFDIDLTPIKLPEETKTDTGFFDY